MPNPDFLLEVGIDYELSLESFEDGLNRIVSTLNKKDNKVKIDFDLGSKEFKEFQDTVTNSLRGIAGAAKFSMEMLNELSKTVSEINKKDFSASLNFGKVLTDDAKMAAAQYKTSVKNYVANVKEAYSEIRRLADSGNMRSVASRIGIDIKDSSKYLNQFYGEIGEMERKSKAFANIGPLSGVAGDAKAYADAIAPILEKLVSAGASTFDMKKLLEVPEVPVTAVDKVRDTFTGLGDVIAKITEEQTRAAKQTQEAMLNEGQTTEATNRFFEEHAKAVEEAAKAEGEKIEISKQLLDALQKENEALNLGDEKNWFSGIAESLGAIRNSIGSIREFTDELRELGNVGRGAKVSVESMGKSAQQIEMGRFIAQLETVQAKYEALDKKPVKLTENMAALRNAEFEIETAEGTEEQYAALQKFATILQVVKDQLAAESAEERNASKASREYQKSINDLQKEFDQITKIFNQFSNDSLHSTLENLRIDFDKIENKPEALTKNMTALESAWEQLKSAFENGDINKIREAFREWEIALQGVQKAMAPAKKQQSIVDKANAEEQRRAAREAAEAFKYLQQLQSKISSSVLERNNLTFADTDKYTSLTEKLRLLDAEYKQFMRDNREKLSDEQIIRLNKGWEELRRNIREADAATEKAVSRMTASDAKATAVKEENEAYKKLLATIKEIGSARTAKQKALFAGDEEGAKRESKNLEEALKKYREYKAMLSDGMTAEQQKKVTAEFVKQNRELERLRGNQAKQKADSAAKQEERDAREAEKALEKLNKLREQASGIDLQEQSGAISRSLEELFAKANQLTAITPQLEEHLARIVDLIHIFSDPNATDDQKVKAMEEYTRLTKEAGKALDELLAKEGKDASTQNARKRAYDDLSAALLNIEKMKQRVANGFQGRNSQTYQDLVALEVEAVRLRDSLADMTGAQVQSGLDQFNKSLAEAKLNVERTSGSIRNMDNPLSMLESKLASTISLGALIMKTVQQVKKMVTEVINLDTSMTQLRVVTNNSKADYEEYGRAVTQIAKDIGASVSDIVDSTTVFARLGYTLSESKELSRTTAMLANVGDIDISSAQSAVTTMTKAFRDVNAEQIESTMDKLVEVGNNFPISVSEIAAGIDNAGSSLSAAGNSFEEAVALLTSANTAVQNISKASTGLRTISARIRRTTFDLDELGETIEEAKYQEAMDILTGHGVRLTENGEYRSTYAILKDIASVWNELGSMDQAAIAEQLAGTRQQNIFFSLVEQFGEAENAMKSMKNSAGSLQEAYDEYSDSIQKHIDSFKAAFTELSQEVVNSDLVRNIVDFGTRIVEALSKVFTWLNKIGATLPLVIGLASKLVINNFGKIAKMTGLEDLVKGIILTGKKIKDVVGEAGGSVGQALLKLVSSAKPLLATLGPIAVLIGSVTAALLWYKKACKDAFPTTQELADDYRNASEEAKKLSDQIDHNNKRLEELEELKGTSGWTKELEAERIALENENKELGEQLSLLSDIAKYKRETYTEKVKRDIGFFFNTGRTESVDDNTFLGSHEKRSETGFGGMLNAIDDYTEKLKELEALEERRRNHDWDNQAEAEALNSDILEAKQSVVEYAEKVDAFRESLVEWRSALAESYIEDGDTEAIEKIAEINNALDLMAKSTKKGGKSFDDFKKKLEKLNSDTLKKFLNGLELSEDEQKEFAKWMLQSGYRAEEVSSYLSHYVAELRRSADANLQHDEAVKKSLGDVSGFKDELKEVSDALEAYNKAMEGGEKGDSVAKMAEIYKGAMEDLQSGKIDSNRMHAVADLLFSPEQLAEWGYDITKVAEALNSDIMKALFDPEDKSNLDYGQRFAKYVKENFSRADGVWVDGNNFYYDSIDKVAKAFGMSREACEAFLDSLDAYGVNVMRSTEENEELIRQFDEIQFSAENAGNAVNAVKKFIKDLQAEGRDKYEIASILHDLSDQGVINVDKSTLDATLADVWQELDSVDNASPEVDIGVIDNATSTASQIYRNIQALFGQPIFGTVYIKQGYVNNGVTGTVLPTDPSIAKNQRAAGKAPGQRGGKTLVNELGPELISDRGEAYIANGGAPGFTVLSDDAIVFTADETEKILRGQKNVRAKAKAQGSGRAGLRARLLNGERTQARGVPTGVATQLESSGRIKCVCGVYLTKNFTGTCWNCGRRYVNGVLQVSLQEAEKIADTSARPVSDPQPQPQQERRPVTTVSVKLCPGCKSYVAASLQTCPNCGHIFGRDEAVTTAKKTYYDDQSGNRVSRRTTGVAPQGINDGDQYVGIGVGDGGGGGGGGADSQSRTNPQKIDWIAVRINRLQKAVSGFQKVATSGLKSLATRLKAARDEASKLTEELNTMEQAAVRYEQEANNVGLDESIAKLVREGTIDISEYEDEELRQKIQEYQEWYEKMLECQEAVEDLHQTLGQLYADDFANVQADYENRLAQIEHNASLAQKDLQMAQTKGYLESAKFYERQAELEVENGKMLRSELEELNSRLATAMSSGEIEEGSEAWFDMKNQINAVEEAIADSNIALEQFQKTMRNLQWSYFDYAQERFSQIQEEANFLLNLMSNDNMYKDNGQLNRTGKAAVGMHVVNYDAYMSQADAYAQELKRINQELAKDPYDTELIARREQLLQLQRQSILSAEQEKDAVKSLVEQGINKELESIRDLIDAYTESLDSAKSLYEYQEKIADKSKAVSKIQKQLSAYTNDDSEETRAKVQKLNEDLLKAQKDLRDTENEQAINDQKKLLDEVYKQYEELMNGRLDDVDALMREMIDMSNQNAGSIKSEISAAAKEVGYTVSPDLKQIVTNGMAYYDKDFKDTASTNSILGKIHDKVAAMALASGAVKAYATGGLVDYTGLAAVHGTPGKPELMLNADDTKNFLAAAAMLRDTLMANQFTGHTRLPQAESTGGGIGTINIGPIQIDHVQDYNDFVRQLRDDPKFEKLVGTIAHDPLLGKSSFRKNTISFR